MLKKRLVAWVLMFALCFYSMPVYAFAQEASDTAGADDTTISADEPSDTETAGDVSDEGNNDESGVGDDVTAEEAGDNSDAVEENGDDGQETGDIEEGETSDNDGQEPGDVTGDEDSDGEITGSTEPTEPAEPADPADKETPEVPETPVEDEQPTDTETPETPEEPSKPEIPAEDEEQEDQGTLESPVLPEDENVVKPGEQETPETPVVPEENKPVVEEETKEPAVTIPIDQVPVLPELDILTGNLQQMMAAPMLLNLEEPVCTCEYRCTRELIYQDFWGVHKYVTRTEDCPVCGGEDGDWEHGCQGRMIIADGDPDTAKPEDFYRWFDRAGIQGNPKANCTTPEAWTIVNFNTGAEWFFAFNEETGLNPDNHYYSDYGSKAYTIIEPTCTEDGSKTYMECLLCGEVVVETIPANGHKIDEATVTVVEPTCTEEGYKTGVCTVCGEEVVEVIEAAGHKLDENAIVVTEATCTTAGSKVGHCTVCGEDIVIEVIKVLGHDYIYNVTQEATCTVDGSQTVTCSRCDYHSEEVIPSAGGHTWPEGLALPGSIKGVCTECGSTLYYVYTYEEGATPSGSGWEIQLCVRVIQEKDGTIYAIDDKGNVLSDEDFAVVINESLMGKNKSFKDEDGNVVMTKVVGYRNMDKDSSTIYKVGDRISIAEVPGMYVDVKGSMANYQSLNSRKIIFLGAVRENLPSFGPKPEVPVDPNKPVTPEQPIDPNKSVTPEVPVVSVVPEETFVINKVPYAYTVQDNQVSRSGLAATSAGITSDFEYNAAGTTCVITYTIPADYTGRTVDINASDDVMLAYRTIQDRRFGNQGSQPGDTLGPVYIRLVNLSNRTFAYNDGSFVLQSSEHSDGPTYIDPIYTFDGVNPPEGSVPSRVSNGALRFLYNATTDLGEYELSDEVLGETLRSVGYENGVADLHQYYLDYYNNFYSNGNQWQSLSEVPFELLVQRDEGIFGGQSSTAGLKETNPEVAGLGFSFFYTRLMSVIPGNRENLKDFAGDYAVGNYMKQYVSYNDNAKAVWGTLASGSDEQLDGMSVYINGESNNFYQNTAWGIEVGFSLTSEPGSPDIPENPGDDSSGDDEPTTPPTTTTTVDEPPVPLTETPTEEIILDEEVPLSGVPNEDEEILLDEEVPLAQVPKTGDNLILWFFAAVASAIGALGLGRKRD